MMLRLLVHLGIGMRPLLGDAGSDGDGSGQEEEPLELLEPRLFKETGLGSGHVQGGPYNRCARNETVLFLLFRRFVQVHYK
jgi:hypothetical protein